MVNYHNDDAFSELLTNVTEMLGKNYVIERTGPVSRTLAFIDQQEPWDFPATNDNRDASNLASS